MSGRSFLHRALLQDAAVADGNGTPMDVAGLSYVGLQATGITTATLNWEGTVDGSTYAAIQVTPLATGTAATTATGNGLFRANVAGLQKIRARISGWGVGAVIVTGLGLAET